MLAGGESPGSIRNQVGRSINAIRDCIEQNDVYGLANHVALLIAISQPKLSPQEMERLKLPTVPEGRDRDGEKARALFAGCMRVLGDLLTILSTHGIYAYQEASMTAPESGLALALRDEDDEEGAES